jgi:hypothetical protein
MWKQIVENLSLNFFIVYFHDFIHIFTVYHHISVKNKDILELQFACTAALKKLSARWNMYLYIVRATCTNTDLDSRYSYLKINNSANCITYWKVYTCYLKIHIWIMPRQRSMWSAREILSFRYCTAHDYCNETAVNQLQRIHP